MSEQASLPGSATGASQWARARRHVAAAVAVSWREAVPFAVLASLALVLRLIDLGGRPLHHDESAHAWFAWRLVDIPSYHYDPVFHGPVQFYFMGLVDLLLGAGDTVARIPPVLMGTVVVFLPFFLRRQIGGVAALTASLLLCLSPSYLTFSRFAREDIYVACVTLALVIVLIRFLERPRAWHPPAFLGLLAVSFATKETTYITVFVVGLYLGALVVAQGVRAGRRGGGWRQRTLLGDALGLGVGPWAWGGFAFLVVFTLLFTTLLASPEGLQEGLIGSIRYWLSQQPVGRGGQPWFYYLVLLPAYEWVALLLGLVGIVVVLRRPTTGGVFLVWMFAWSLAIFSWASERMPWLVLHPLLPLILLAGIGTQALWGARQRWSGKLALLVAAVALVGSVAVGVRAAYFLSADPRELLVQVQTTEDVPAIRSEIQRLDAAVRRSTGKPLDLVVDSSGGTAWPWGWYLRDMRVDYDDLSRPGSVTRRPQALLVVGRNDEAMAPRLPGYVPTRFRLRAWWVVGWGDGSPRDWARWLVHRRVWTPTGSLEERLYLRPDVAKLVSES